MRKKKRKTKTTTGGNRRIFLLALTPIGGLFAADPYAVIAGSVFRDPGFALPNAEVHLTVLQPPAVKKKPKEQRMKSDARGEFAFRVPAGAAKYRLSVSAPGMTTEAKEVAVAADERVDSYFQLKPVAP